MCTNDNSDTEIRIKSNCFKKTVIIKLNSEDDDFKQIKEMLLKLSELKN
jgi:hypothetical protein